MEGKRTVLATLHLKYHFRSAITYITSHGGLKRSVFVLNEWLDSTRGVYGP